MKNLKFKVLMHFNMLWIRIHTNWCFERFFYSSEYYKFNIKQSIYRRHIMRIMYNKSTLRFFLSRTSPRYSQFCRITWARSRCSNLQFMLPFILLFFHSFLFIAKPIWIDTNLLLYIKDEASFGAWRPHSTPNSSPNRTSRRATFQLIVWD